MERMKWGEVCFGIMLTGILIFWLLSMTAPLGDSDVTSSLMVLFGNYEGAIEVYK